MTKSISIIIPFRETDNKSVYRLELCLVSLLNQSFVNYEILVISDGSHLFFPGIPTKLVKFIPFEGSRGEKRNHGINSATNDYLIFLDSDTIFPPTELEKVVNLIDEQTICYGAYRREILLPELDGSLRSAVYNKNWDYIKTISRPKVQRLFTISILDNFSYITNFGAMHSKLVKSVGYFDENINSWGGEDLDLMIRLHNGHAKERHLFRDKIVVYHLEHLVQPRRFQYLLSNTSYLLNKYSMDENQFISTCFELFSLRLDPFSDSGVSYENKELSVYNKEILLHYVSKYDLNAKKITREIEKVISRYNTSSIFLDGSILLENQKSHDIDLRIITNHNTFFEIIPISDDLTLEINHLSIESLITYLKNYWTIPTSILWEFGGIKHSKLIFDRCSIGKHFITLCDNFPHDLRLFELTFGIGSVIFLTSKFARKRVELDGITLDLKRSIVIIDSILKNELPDAYWIHDFEYSKDVLDLYKNLTTDKTLASLKQLLEKYKDFIISLINEVPFDRYLIYPQNHEASKYLFDIFNISKTLPNSLYS